MIQLIYPIDTAPVIGADSDGTRPGAGPAGNGTAGQSGPAAAARSCEMLPIVEPDGRVIAQASRAYCHSCFRPLHPVVHLEIVNRFGQIYLQKRSASKKLLPGLWDTAVGGHVSYGEFIQEALFREAGEELGLEEFNPIFIDSYISETELERELVNMFAIVGNFQPVPDRDEVSEGRYWSPEEIDSQIGKGVLTPLFESEFLRYRDKLLALL